MWTTKKERFDNLPIKESRKYFITREFGNMYNIDKFDHPWKRSHKKDSINRRIDKVICKFLGKHFNNAFSYFCHLPKINLYDQNYFLNYFFNPRYERKYSLDNNYIILINPRYIKYKRSKIVFKSIDYKELWWHPRHGWVDDSYITIINLNINPTFYDKNSPYIVSGFVKTFLRKDNEFRKLHSEKLKKLKNG